MIRFIARLILACRIRACELHLAMTYERRIDNSLEFARVLAIRERASRQLARLRGRQRQLTGKPGQCRTFDLA
jgi:hypothetical protein